ncbi:hypothetical protein CCHL11_09976 [Colletotrichum chlorophyti]|uniref:Uncharacterized protein n=1 Tax=Colletotrichum chlorophyti TaxID=708187 RepID=A0A1Q8R9J2_9PEZI|nr:hypothetical protein CCHL11_09976 [Colletotrichum chlorophyti]
MSEDRRSESTADDAVASTHAHPPSASGRSSRPPSPDPVQSDPNVALGQRIPPPSPLASHRESLMDMRIPQALPSPRLGRKRSIDEVVDDSTPPSPDKLLRELDQQHEEARNIDRTLSFPPQPRPQFYSRDHGSKRRRTLVLRGKKPSRDDAFSSDLAHDGADDQCGNSTKRPSSSGSNSSTKR